MIKRDKTNNYENIAREIREISKRVRTSGKPLCEWFPKYTITSLLNAENWWEAFAVCDYALDTKADEKLTERFF